MHAGNGHAHSLKSGLAEWFSFSTNNKKKIYFVVILRVKKQKMLIRLND